MKIGFIGAGNMAGAIIRGVRAAGVWDMRQIAVFDIDAAKARSLAEETGACAYAELPELVADCDGIVLSIKPAVFPVVLPQIAEQVLLKKPLVISIAAGKTTQYITRFLDESVPVVRVMPNINAKVGAAMSAFCTGGPVTREQEEAVSLLFGAIGKIIPLDEKFFPLFGVLAGSAPAFAYLFIDSLARAAVKNGMSKQMALEIAAQMTLGSAKLVLESGEHPWSLIDQVCSPGGTTIEGIAQLQDNGFESALRKAVDAALDKDSKI